MRETHRTYHDPSAAHEYALRCQAAGAFRVTITKGARGWDVCARYRADGEAS